MEFPAYLTVRAGAAAIFLSALWIIEGAWPMFYGRERRGQHYASNLKLGLLNAVFAATAISAGLLFATEYAISVEFGLLHVLNWHAAAEWALVLVALDLWQYAWHRATHSVKFLWRFHAVHHTDAEMDASTSLRFHTGEIAIAAVARMATLPLLGVSIVHLAAYEALALPIVLFHHSNVYVGSRLDRVLRLVVVTPWMHWVHHSNHQPETDSNYASVLSIWDRLFGTFRMRSDPRTVELGLDGYSESERNTFRGMFRTPFSRRFRRPRRA